MNRAQAHWHPEAMDEPCQHDDTATPGLQWPAWLTVTLLAVGLLVTGYLVWLAVTAL